MSSTSEISEKELVVGNAALEEGVKVRNSHHIEWVVGRLTQPENTQEQSVIGAAVSPSFACVSPFQQNKQRS